MDKLFSEHRENIAKDLEDWFRQIRKLWISTREADEKLTSDARSAGTIGKDEEITTNRDIFYEEKYPIEIETVLAGSRDPVNIANTSKLPAVFFQYGRSRPNPAIKKPNTHRGETIDYAVFIVVNAVPEKNIGLLTRSARMHSLMEILVEEKQYLGNREDNASHSRTREVRLGQSRGYGFRKIQDKGFIEFHVEIDHIYPIHRTGVRYKLVRA